MCDRNDRRKLEMIVHLSSVNLNEKDKRVQFLSESGNKRKHV